MVVRVLVESEGGNSSRRARPVCTEDIEMIW